MKLKEKNIFYKNKIQYIQFTVNPYRRTVSSYLFYMKYGYGYKNKILDMSFYDFISSILNKNIEDNIHHRSQIFFIEKNIDYIKLEKFKFNINNFNKKYNLNFKIPETKHTPQHHMKKNKYLEKKYIGNIKYSIIKNNIPIDYSLFYDDKIKENVEKIYGEDIKKLNYTWDEFKNTLIK